MFLNAFQECCSAPLQISVHLPVAHVPDQHLQVSTEGRGLSKGAVRSKCLPCRHLRGRRFGRRCLAAGGCAANNPLVGQLESECICKDTLEGCFVLLRGLCPRLEHANFRQPLQAEVQRQLRRRQEATGSAMESGPVAAPLLPLIHRFLDDRAPPFVPIRSISRRSHVRTSLCSGQARDKPLAVLHSMPVCARWRVRLKSCLWTGPIPGATQQGPNVACGRA